MAGHEGKVPLGVGEASGENEVILTNERVTLVFDKRTGRLTRLRNRQAGDEVQKLRPGTPDEPVGPLQTILPFAVEVENFGEDGETGVYRLPDEHWHVQKLEATHLQASFQLEASLPLGAMLEVAYSVELIPGDWETKWSIRVSNRSTQHTVTGVDFPRLTDLILGSSKADDVLMYPYYAGLRVENPVAALFSDETVTTGGAFRSIIRPDGLRAVEHFYCGNASMMWMDLSDTAAGSGVSMASYDDDLLLTALRVAAPHPSSGLQMTLSKRRRILPGEEWASFQYGVGLHGGDWHVVADRYRSWADRRFARPPVPDWVRASHALMAHYDFKWQDGTFTHTFADIPALYNRAAADGITHLFLAGWSTGGFDHMYPEYYPDLTLGTVMDFLNGIRTVREQGGKVTLYINTALFGMASQYHATLGMAWAAKAADGSPYQRHFFHKDFTVSCRGARGYQRQIADTVEWLVGEACATGVYLDCFAAIGPYECHDPSHDHAHPATWNADAERTLERVRKALEARGLQPFTMIEGCGDAYGQHVTAQLIHGWYVYPMYPEMMKYTFPRSVQVDMVYPSRGQTFRSPEVSARAYDQLHRAFIRGCLLWFYDQEDTRYCNFRTDPEMWLHIQKVIALRQAAQPYIGFGRFLDTVGVRPSDPSIEAKAYEWNGNLLLTIWNQEEREDGYVEVMAPQGTVSVTIQGLGVEAISVQPVPCDDTTTARADRTATVPVYDTGHCWIRIPLAPQVLSVCILETNAPHEGMSVRTENGCTGRDSFTPEGSF